jgi:hypothetical protein
MYNSDLPTRAELPTSKQLLRSTVIAVVTAAILLVTVVLPSEYAIDPTGIGRMLGLTQMGEIKVSLAEEAEGDRAADASRRASGQTAETPPESSVQSRRGATAQPGTAVGPASTRRTDEMSVTLKPGEGTEVKLDMAKGATVSYEWTTAGGHVNHDTHADGPNRASHSYSKGRQMIRDAGEITAPFDGNHGWFWRNRSEGDVTVTLKTNGEYRNIKRVL